MHATAPAKVEFRIDPPADGVVNMRLDEELLANAENGKGCCRIYSWTTPWVTLGKYQSAAKDIMPSAQIPWVFRPTGGKAVLHGHDITVGLAMPLGMLVTPEMPVDKLERSIKAVYRAMTGPMIAALRACGLPAKLGEDTRFTDSGERVADCFAHVSPNDIVDERTGAKVCGCALKVTHNAALVQASIPIEKPLIDPAEVIVGGKGIFNSKWEYSRFAEEFEKALNTIVPR